MAFKKDPYTWLIFQVFSMENVKAKYKTIVSRQVSYTCTCSPCNIVQRQKLCYMVNRCRLMSTGCGFPPFRLNFALHCRYLQNMCLLCAKITKEDTCAYIHWERGKKRHHCKSRTLVSIHHLLKCSSNHSCMLSHNQDST